MMAGFGALALFQGMQVYRMQKTLQKQSEILETERSEDDYAAEEVK